MPKNIVICCDGTGNQYGQYNTNVVKIFEMLETSPDQILFYDPGVGTGTNNLIRFFQFFKQKAVQAFGMDLQRNVEDAYYFLMNNFEDGDRIYLFGFSRGAHTVRRLACMLHDCGLLHRGSENMISYASYIYLQEKDEATQKGFRETFARPCPVFFLGVWDTVSALSSLYPRPKLDGVLSKGLTHAFHAVAIDERRLQFPPNLFDFSKKLPNQHFEEVWFPGVHSDVGGYYEERGLSNTALKWMSKKAESLQLKFKPGSIDAIKTDSFDKLHTSWTPLFWVLPNFLYLGAVACLLLLLEKIGWPFQSPFTSTFEWLREHWPVIPFILFVAILLNQRSRRVPKGAKIHRSAKARFDNQKKGYRPWSLRNGIHDEDLVD